MLRQPSNILYCKIYFNDDKYRKLKHVLNPTIISLYGSDLNIGNMLGGTKENKMKTQETKKL